MSRAKWITLCLLAILALCAIVSSAASAASPAWWVNGKLLAVGETAAVAETTEVTTAFTVKSTVVSGECKAVKVKTGDIEGEKQAAVNSLVFSECVDLTEPTKCTTTGFSTKPLSIALEGTTGNLKLKFKPTSGVEVFTIIVSNKTGQICHVAGTFHVDGTMACTYPKVETEAEKHELVFSAASGSKLTVAEGELPLELAGNVLFWLFPKLGWSAK
jgi:hypothetical protein